MPVDWCSGVSFRSDLGGLSPTRAQSSTSNPKETAPVLPLAGWATQPSLQMNSRCSSMIKARVVLAYHKHVKLMLKNY